MSETSSQFIDRISKEYGLYVLDGGRGIPSMYDGLKTSQRIALWLMRNKANKIKTMALAGEMIASELYVHGDASASGAISNLAARFKNNRPLLEGIGGFGSKAEPDAIGAPRYTYVKRGKFAQNNLYIDMDILPMVENHDGSNKMPDVFLPLVPLVLLNGVKGMATGWSTNILPRQYEDLVQAVEDVLLTGKVQNKLMPEYEGYDVGVVEVSPGYYKMSGKATAKNTSTVIITELPPETTLEKYRGVLSGLEEEGKIVSFKEKERKKINIEVKFQRAVLAKLTTEEKLLNYLKLTTYITERIVVLGENGVRLYESAEELVKDWTEWRLAWYQKRYEHMREQAMLDFLFWSSFVACYEGTDKDPGIPKMMDKLYDRPAVRDYMKRLIESHGIDYRPEITERLADLALYRWTQESYERAIREAEYAYERFEKHNKVTESAARQKTVFKKDVQALVKRP